MQEQPKPLKLAVVVHLQRLAHILGAHPVPKHTKRVTRAMSRPVGRPTRDGYLLLKSKWIHKRNTHRCVSIYHIIHTYIYIYIYTQTCTHMKIQLQTYVCSIHVYICIYIRICEAIVEEADAILDVLEVESWRMLATNLGVELTTCNESRRNAHPRVTMP